MSCRSWPPCRDTVRRLKTGGYLTVLPAADAYTRPEPSGSQARPLRAVERAISRVVPPPVSAMYRTFWRFPSLAMNATERSSGDQRGVKYSSAGAAVTVPTCAPLRSRIVSEAPPATF